MAGRLSTQHVGAVHFVSSGGAPSSSYVLNALHSRALLAVRAGQLLNSRLLLKANADASLLTSSGESALHKLFSSSNGDHSNTSPAPSLADVFPNSRSHQAAQPERTRELDQGYSRARSTHQHPICQIR